MGFLTRLQHGWNAFVNKDPTMYQSHSGSSYHRRPDRPILTRGNERSILTTVLERFANDAASIDIKHCRLDANGRYIEDVKSGLNNCLNLEANVDQTGRAFRLDAFMSMFDEGVVALVPTDTNLNPKTGSFDIQSIRTGKILQWWPNRIQVRE